MATSFPPSKRLFLPLTTQAFEWYALKKDIEVRKFRGRFKNALSRNYELAELRKGYSGESRFAVVSQMLVFDNSKNLFDHIDYLRVIPTARSKHEADQLLHNYVGEDRILAIFLSFSLS